MAPDSGKEGLVSSPDKDTSHGSLWKPASLFLLRETVRAAWLRPRGSECQSNGLGLPIPLLPLPPFRGPLQAPDPHSLCGQPCLDLWLVMPNTVGPRHKSPRKTWPRPS